MAVIPQNIFRHELINLEVKIANSTDSTIKGLKGRVVDETYHTLKIETSKGERIISKANCKFIFTLPDKRKVEIDGKLLVSRPEDRIKKKFPSW